MSHRMAKSRLTGRRYVEDPHRRGRDHRFHGRLPSPPSKRQLPLGERRWISGRIKP
jgi:hypothetical protein